MVEVLQKSSARTVHAEARLTAQATGFDGEPTGFIHHHHRGRGALSNQSGRFERESLEPFDDGWGLEELPPFKTTVVLEKAKSIISRNQSPDIPFERSINAYRGCDHGCSYCFARPTHAYMGLSPGLDFESRLFAKPDAPALLERELAAPNYRAKVIALGTNTDPYQPIERTHRITRQLLEVFERTNHPVSIVTKSALITRDIDILAAMASRGLVQVALSVTTLDKKLARAMEPRAASPDKRLDAIQRLSAAGIPTSVLVAPIIPALNDSEIEAILAKAHSHGARDADYVVLRLPLEVAEIFKQWLLHHYPHRYRHVLSLLRSMRAGQDYDAAWGRRMYGCSVYADQIAKRMHLATKKLGMKRRRMRLRSDLFIPPGRPGVQMSLF